MCLHLGSRVRSKLPHGNIIIKKKEQYLTITSPVSSSLVDHLLKIKSNQKKKKILSVFPERLN
uniref:Uncharacterized protein n=1 Tax=Nelumbo nucifera TaxID=4432 RepID=A0A822YBH4_NELNU|nr:TPA_asm: hypothetical protein HUJ06_029843 [Nelumbo nucifera]